MQTGVVVVVVHACNPNAWEAEVGTLKFDANLDYKTRPRLTQTTKMLPGGSVAKIPCSQTDK